MQQNANYPAGLDDAVARKTQWTPIKTGGASFRTHKLVEVSPVRIEFQATLAAKLFYLLFVIAGIGIMAGFSYRWLNNANELSTHKIIIPLITGFVFAGIGFGAFYAGTKPVVFDKNNGCFWKGRKEPDTVLNLDQVKLWTKLERIYAIQLVSEYCRGSKRSYYSYELNLVLDDGSRINVIDHGNINRMREDAAKLSAFLAKPVWDFV